MKLTHFQIAEAIHEANRGYCHALGDYSHAPWKFTPDNIKSSVVDGVIYHLEHPDATPEQSHENWLNFKKSDGWVYVPVKDAQKKEHPCMVPYGDLPVEQRAKDHIVSALISTLKTF